MTKSRGAAEIGMGPRERVELLSDGFWSGERRTGERIEESP